MFSEACVIHSVHLGHDVIYYLAAWSHGLSRGYMMSLPVWLSLQRGVSLQRSVRILLECSVAHLILLPHDFKLSSNSKVTSKSR